ncbi:MAG: SRPBCC family protein [Acidimicrobiia bacterium]|nr:SRPBCC family protein [Acidimicrobiia bacterium]MCL4292544.1 SRPBCC family protein [Acidimicrobiia bacterium]
MADRASERIHIDAPPERCYEVATDYERYPDWIRDIKSAEITERDPDGRGTQVEFRAAALGRSIRYTLAYDYSDAPGSFSWSLVEGDMVRRLDGSYRFEAADDGTRLHYDLTVDLAIPLPGLLKRRASGLIMGNALRGLKKAVEAG